MLNGLLSNVGLGKLVETISDAIGLPEELGDLFAGIVDFAHGNYVGALDHAIDFVDLPAESLLDEFADSGVPLPPIPLFAETVEHAIRL